MRNKNHNRRGVLNTSNPDWNEDRGNYGRGYQNHGYEGDRGNTGSNYGSGSFGSGSSIGGRYDDYGTDRNYNDRGGYSENQNSGFNSGRNRGNRDEGYTNYSDWRSSEYNRGYSGGDNRDYSNYGGEQGGRNDRQRDEYNRSNFEGRNYDRNTGFGGGNYGSGYNDRRREGNQDRDWWDKTSDEVSSWFGDDEAERRRDADKNRSGQHKGKGPKGYSRSDERIKEDINDRLSDDVFVDASEVEVTVMQGEVTLSGSVSGKHEKRRAEDIAEQVSGVRNVENRIKVGSTHSTPSSSTMAGHSTSSSSSSSLSEENGRRTVKQST
jgi:osmotically-inducible protein OsmY